MSNPKIFLFDLETSDLNANRGHILCAAGKWLGEKKVYTWNIYDNPKYAKPPLHVTMQDDSRIAREIRSHLVESSACVAYYGGYGKFDVPYLNTRLIRSGLEPCPPLTIIDPYTTAKSQLRLARNNMDSVASILGCEKKKYHLPWADWSAARYHNKAAMARLLEYCINDVEVLEEVYTKLLPLISNHPYVTEYDGSGDPRLRCPACGSDDSRYRTKRHTRAFVAYRRTCNDCGHTFISHKESITKLWKK